MSFIRPTGDLTPPPSPQTRRWPDRQRPHAALFPPADPQVVAHLLRPAVVRDPAAGLAGDPAAPPPPDPPRGAARDLLLHHHRLAGLAAGEARLLGPAGGGRQLGHGSGAARR